LIRRRDTIFLTEMVHLAHHDFKSARASPRLDHFHRNRWTNSPEYAKCHSDIASGSDCRPPHARGCQDGLGVENHSSQQFRCGSEAMRPTIRLSAPGTGPGGESRHDSFPKFSRLVARCLKGKFAELRICCWAV